MDRRAQLRGAAGAGPGVYGSSDGAQPGVLGESTGAGAGLAAVGGVDLLATGGLAAVRLDAVMHDTDDAPSVHNKGTVLINGVARVCNLPAWHVFPWVNADVVAGSTNLLLNKTLLTLPKGAYVHRAIIAVSSAALGLSTLTAAVGVTATDYADFIQAADIMTAAVYGDASGEVGTSLDDYAGYLATAAVDVILQFVGTHASKKLRDVTVSIGNVALLISYPFESADMP